SLSLLTIYQFYLTFPIHILSTLIRLNLLFTQKIPCSYSKKSEPKRHSSSSSSFINFFLSFLSLLP
ncbi:unnamed protein product, partial [Brassica oleracea]